MALQAQQVDVAQPQHVRVRAAMCQVARLASVDLYRRMLVHKRALLVRVTLEADRILRRVGPHLLRPHCPVRIVAVAALNEPLIHAVMERHFELRLLLEVAGVAKLGLRLCEQEVRFFSLMRGVAGDATDVRSFMLGVAGIHVLRATRVARQAPLVNVLGRVIVKDENLARVAAAFHVRATWPVAVLAPVFRDAAFLECLLPVRAFFPTVVNVFVAGLAGFRANVGRSRLGIFGLGRLGAGCRWRLLLLLRGGSTRHEKRKQGQYQECQQPPASTRSVSAHPHAPLQSTNRRAIKSSGKTGTLLARAF